MESEILSSEYIPDQEELEFYNSRYFKLNMHMLRFIGLWPYQNKLAKMVIRTFFSGIVIISLVPQVICAIVFTNNAFRMFQCIGTILYMFGMLAKFFSTLIYENKLKILYKAMAKNWKLLDNESEKAILAKHSDIGRLLTIRYLGYMIVTLFFFVCSPITPRMINKIKPIFNGTIIHMYILDGEYLVDREEHYHQIYLFEATFCIMSVPIFTTIDSTYAVCVQQCVGLFSVVKLRLKLSTKKSNSIVVHRGKDQAYDLIVESVKLHEKVLNYGQLLESSYSTCFFIVLVFNTAILSNTSACILTNLDNEVILVRYFCLAAGFIIHMFYLSWPGQKLIDGSNDIFYAAYNCEWYECSVKSQKLLKFIMQKTSEPFYLTAGGFYIMNFQNFEMLIKTAISYIAVLSSFQ